MTITTMTALQHLDAMGALARRPQLQVPPCSQLWVAML
jgi:hypothetical protein